MFYLSGLKGKRMKQIYFILYLLVVSSTLTTKAYAAFTCDFEKVFGSCAAMSNEPVIKKNYINPRNRSQGYDGYKINFKRIYDYTRTDVDKYWNTIDDIQQLFSSEVSNFHNRRITKIYNELKDILLDDLRKNLPSHVKKTIITRLEKVSLSILDKNEDDHCKIKEKTNLPYFAHERLNHTIEICDYAAILPSIELAATISHELGHVIDPDWVSDSLLLKDANGKLYGAEIKKQDSKHYRAQVYYEGTMYRVYFNTSNNGFYASHSKLDGTKDDYEPLP
jgi:hypothetical protein